MNTSSTNYKVKVVKLQEKCGRNLLNYGYFKTQGLITYREHSKIMQELRAFEDKQVKGGGSQSIG